jgi:hypothetical protein
MAKSRSQNYSIQARNRAVPAHNRTSQYITRGTLNRGGRHQ